jgi:Cu-processing system permease protein
MITLHTLRECTRRKVFLLVPIATIGFVALYALGNHFAFQSTTGTTNFGEGLVDARALTGASLVGLSIFVTLFLASSVGIFITFGTVRGDAEQGTLQAFVVRPVARWGFMVGRFVGASIVCASFSLFLYIASVSITWVVGSWHPDPLIQPGLLVIAAVEVVIILCLLGSTFLSALANGIGVFMLYGAGLLAGLLGQLGEALNQPSLEQIGKVTSWVLPFEALYQAALNSLTSGATGITRVIVQLGPLGGAEPGGGALVAWFFVYVLGIGALAIRQFNRSDL